MFQGRSIICSAGNPAQFVCTCPDCESTLFVCSRTCACFSPHNSTKCTLKNIKDLSNGIETLLKRNFCKVFKGEGIQIVARVAKQTYKIPRNFRFCFTQCRAEEKRDMEFEIRNLKGCIGVGVLHKPTIIRHQFQYLPDSDYINHGSYMILSNGYQYSHCSQQQNFKEYKGISLEQGKRVRLYIEAQQLIFQQGYHKVRLQLPHQMQDLYYGIYLYDEGDEVQVLVKK